MKWLKRFGYTVAVLYLLAVVLLYFFQERLIFHPTALPAGYVFASAEEEYLTTGDGVDLHLAVYRGQEEEAGGAILYLHGNRGSNRRSVSQIQPLLRPGYDLYALDYRGYGKSGGRPQSEEQLFSDARQVYDSLAVRYGEANILVVGYSLGTGMASHLGAYRQPAHVVLVAPYASLTAMKNLWFWAVPDFILRYPLDNLRNVAEANCRITILHGEQDPLIPYTMAEELRAAAPDRVELIALPGTSHRGAIFHEAFGRTIDRLTE